MADEQKEAIVENVQDAMNLMDAANCIKFLRLTKSLIVSLEKRIVKAELSDEYVNLINDINQPSEFTLTWICDQYVNFGLNFGITDALLKKEAYVEYVSGKTLFKKYFTFQPDIIPIEDYLWIYVNNDEVFEFMQFNDEILQSIINHGDFEELSSERIMPLTRFRQPFGLVKRAFEIISSDEFEQYLLSFRHLDTAEDSRAFLELIKYGSNYEKLNTRKSRYHAREKLWERGERASFSMHMKKYYGKEFWNSFDEMGFVD